MVLAFALRLLGSSTLLLAVAPGAQAARCPFPRVQNGKRASVGRGFYRDGDTVSFVCHTGYTLHGSSTSRCQADSRWSPPLPVCKKEVTCPRPPNIANGLHSGQSLDKFSPGVIVYYGCKDGYQHMGNTSISCTETGVWSRPLPRCQAIGCTTPRVRNGKVHDPLGTYKAGETLHFDCDAGYTPEDSDEALCQPGGTWDPPVLICHRVQPCPMPPEVSNGHHNGKGEASFTMGMFVTYTCDPGYYLVGSSVVFCRASGRWSQPGPRCAEVTCPRPPNIANGLHSGQSLDKFSRGAIVYYSCKDGYQRVGNISISCTEAGVWSRPLPRCQAIGCTTPRVRNGKVHDPLGTYKAGETLHFDCDDGYAAEGTYTSLCQPGGTWDPPVLVCHRVQPCPMPPGIRNGLHSGQGQAFFTTGMSVTYTCDPGYYLVGSAVVFCRASGNWSQPGPRCAATVCVNPDVANGKRVEGQGLLSAPGQAVTFRCQDGSSLRGSAQIFCQEDGSWHPPPPVCDKLHGPLASQRNLQLPGACAAPPRLHFAELREEHRNEIDFSVGKTAQYACRPGYAEVPGLSPTVTCLPSGVWSEALEFCKRKQCGHPGEPVNGKIISLTDLLFGSTVRYVCEEGYRLIGQSSRRCEVSGGRVAWSGDLPICQRIPCEPPPDIPNGKHTGRMLDEFHFGTSVTYTCNPGYPLHGEPSIHCTSRDGINGVWSGPLPRCGDAGCPAPQIQNGRIVSPSSAYAHNDTVAFECDPGYVLRGHRVVQCQLSDTWEPPVPFCEQDGCNAPTRLVFAEPKEPYSNQSVFPVGSTVEYVCQPGYVQQPGMSPTITCVRNRTWSAALEFCRKVQCPPPPGIANGKHSSQPTDIHLPGSAVRYTCLDGYSLIGNASISCTSRGTWSRPQPRCEAIGCKRPEIKNGRTTGLETTYRPADTVVFECDFGFALKGSQESQCKFGGTWDPPVPVCEEMLQCPSPPSIKNGKQEPKEVKAFIPGVSVKYHCDPGYVLTGKTTVLCLTTGTWSIPYPRCEVVTCTSPDIPNGAVAEGQSAEYRPGANVTFQCRPGYVLGGSREAKCQPDGRWAPPVPTCQPALPCPPPPVIANATHSAEPGANFTSGMSVRYRCQPGFFLLGDPSVWCSAWGNWSLPYPRCAAGCGAPTPLLFAELNQEYRNQTMFPIGETVRFTCRPGYVKHPQIPPTLTCLENQTWSEAREFCKRRKCDHPGEPENGRVIITTDLFFGSTVNYTCDEGHRLVGASQRHCVISSSGTRVRWSGDVPVCQSITCNPPPDIPHGRHSGHLRDTFSYSDVVTYTCDPGHPLVGEPSIFCTTSDGEHGVWSGRPPRCGGWPCPSPPAIDHGQHDGKDVDEFMPGESVNYSCDPGYSLLGKTTLSCTANGTWSIPYPRCEVVTCTSPDIPNGAVAEGQSAEYRPGANVTFQCRLGYVLGGSREAKCQPDGRWAPPVPTCLPVLHCSPPPSIDHGNHSSPDLEVFFPGMVVNYSCDPGYSLQGEDSIYCTDSGYWSLPLPQCARGCGSPPNLTFAELSEESQNLTEFAAGDTVRYKCRLGYTRHSRVPPTLTCLTNHTWSEALAFCKRKRCKYPERPKNGRVVVLTDLRFGSTVNHTCDEGHRLVGERYRRCELFGADLAWSGVLPICQKVTCPAPQLQNGRVSALKYRYAYKDTVSFRCHQGFTLRGHRTSQCRANKTWDPPVPVCERDGLAEPYHHPDTSMKPELKCPPPPRVANGEHDSHFLDTFDVGAFVSYRCKQGFSLAGNKSLRCTTSGAWSHPPPRCEALRCSKPAVITHGSHDGSAKAFFTPGTSVSYVCEDGFSLLGTASISCTQSGAWSHPPPICQAVKCFPPPNITNGKLKGNISDTFSYGASVSYSCNPGYSLVGDAFINCTGSGTWSQPPPRCEEIRCVFPEVQGVKKGISGNTYHPGANVTLECDDGYTLDGINQIQCQEDFSWDPPVPACKLASRGSGSVSLGVVAAGALLLLGAGVVWKVISKQKEGYYETYENCSYQTPLNPVTEQKCSCLPQEAGHPCCY